MEFIFFAAILLLFYVVKGPKRKKRHDEVLSVRSNSETVDLFMKNNNGGVKNHGDFTFEYLYTCTEPVNQQKDLGSVITIRVESPVHDHVWLIPTNDTTLQKAIDDHHASLISLPAHVSKSDTRWMYFNTTTVFRTI